MVTLELEARLDNLLVTAQEETADLDVFTPIPAREECPLCLIPLPFDEGETTFMSCCGKTICHGCNYKRELMTLNEIERTRTPIYEQKCAFCRQKTKNSIKELKKLMKKNVPCAYMMMAGLYKSGEGVIQSDTKCLEMRIRAAELGYARAFGLIGIAYHEGIVVEENMSKAFEYCEIAAKKGSVFIHLFMANYAIDTQVCTKHLKVAACAGDQNSMDGLMKYYKDKSISKEELAQTLRAFQASSGEMKSKDRDDARAAAARGFWAVAKGGAMTTGYY